MLIDISDSLRNFIKNERRDREVKSADLSKDIGRGSAYVMNIENGKVAQIEEETLEQLILRITDLDRERTERIITLLKERIHRKEVEKTAPIYIDFKQGFSLLHEKFDKELEDLVNNIKAVRDVNIAYVVDTLEQLNKTFISDAGLILGLLRIELYKLDKMRFDKKTEFIQKIINLLDEYYYFR